jgi:anti-sigma factor RsiW
MKTRKDCREWRESLGAYALGQVDEEERARIDAHLEGCDSCRAELALLDPVVRMLPHADPVHFGPAPQPPAELGAQIAATIEAERNERRKRGNRRRYGFALGGATALAAAALALFVLLPGGSGEPGQEVTFGSVPAGVKIDAKLLPHAYGTEIQMYVKGVSSGTLCRVFVRARDGSVYQAGTFRYRNDDDSEAVLSSALDISQTAAIGVHAGGRTFVAPVGKSPAAATGIDAGDST